METTEMDRGVMPPPRPRSGCMKSGCLVMGGAVLGVVGFIVMAILGKGCIGNAKFSTAGLSVSSAGEDESPNLEEYWSSGHGEKKVVCVSINGMIHFGKRSQWGSEDNTTFALRAIRRATEDESVDGLLLDIDSGGGSVTASDILYQAVKNFKAKKKGRKVVTIMGDVAASGAYYIALASDQIYAHPTTLTGSIGVLLQSVNIKGLAEKIGISDVTVKSGVNKDLLNPFHDVSGEQFEMLHRVIDVLYNRFVGLVAENRKLAKENVLPLADGRVFAAPDALEKKLIDQIGYASDAKQKLAELLDEEDVKVYRYRQKDSLLELFFSASAGGISRDLRSLLRGESEEPKVLYRWNP
ncbi:MAG: signal peptide peptidase SppA [Kiritimatiellae bacterium]|nr:signal peptide peptidase SppA [Kiritimatiellia bacterium]